MAICVISNKKPNKYLDYRDKINKLYEFIIDFYELKRDKEDNIDFYNEINNLNISIGTKNYFCIILDYFPKDFVIEIINRFINERIYNYLVYEEVKKYLYSHWNDNIVKEQVDKIKNILIETSNFTKDEYYDILHNYNNPKYNHEKHYKYYVCWLYCFYPLLDNYEDLILKLVNLVYLDDGQDELLDGLLKMPSKKLVNFYNHFLLNVCKSKNAINQDKCFNIWSIATGAYQQNIEIIKKLKFEENYNILEDELLYDFWLNDENKMHIEDIKKLKF